MEEENIQHTNSEMPEVPDFIKTPIAVKRAMGEKHTIRVDDILAVGKSERQEEVEVASKPDPREIVLNDMQIQKVMLAWQSGVRKLKELTTVAFGGSFDGRTFEGKAVKRLMITKGLDPESSAPKYERLANVDLLTDGQKQKIGELYNEHTPLEIAQELFGSTELTNFSVETRTVKEFIKTLPNNYLDNNTDLFESGYRPPVREIETIGKVKKYVQGSRLDKDKLTQKQRTELRALQGFMNNMRFIRTIDSFDNQADKDLFEERMVNYTHDKPDLPPEEVDAYINLCSDIVALNHNTAEINKVRNMMLGTDENDEGDKRIAMALVESLNSLQAERNDNLKRQTSLRESLTGKRSERMKNKMSNNQSVHNLVEAWKNEDTRKEIIAYAELEKGLVDKEISRFADMDAVRGLIMGITREEILNLEP